MRRVHKPAIMRSETRRLGARLRLIQDEDLMPSERRFRDDGTKATRFYKPDDGDDRMNENDQDVVHAGIVSKSKKSRNSGRFCNSPPTRRSRKALRWSVATPRMWTLLNAVGGDMERCLGPAEELPNPRANSNQRVSDHSSTWLIDTTTA
jgi:hypothetical protein